MRSKTPSLAGRLMIMLLALVASLPGARADGNDCPAIVPADAVALGELRLCNATSGSPDELSACRNYGADSHTFRIDFRGGVVPVAVRRLAVASTQDEASPAPATVIEAGKRGCDLTRPAGVPRNAVYRGTGVCRDEHDKALPCSVYEGASARQPVAMRYFAYYEPDGRGIRHVDSLPAGPNKSALEAEVAYQLGQALAASECCREQARSYIAHAVGLFPDDSTYRATFDLLAAVPEAPALATSNCATDSTPALSASNAGP